VATRKTQGDAATATRETTKRPLRFRVVLYNDDYTTMEFVVTLLESIFRKSPAEAVQVMLKVHKEGRGIAGVYPREVAETKVSAVHEAARHAGYPLRSGMEEE
jgi:ATP-dependent Clp protease adaptor protein ClpS